MPYPEIPDNYEDLVRTKPNEFAPHYSGSRFLIRSRTCCSECGPRLEVYGYGLEHICWAPNYEIGLMIANALETAANKLNEDNS